MKIKKLSVEASRVIRTLAKKYCLNPVYLWQTIEDEFGMVKGTSPRMTQDEIDALEDICKHAFD